MGNPLPNWTPPNLPFQPPEIPDHKSPGWGDCKSVSLRQAWPLEGPLCQADPGSRCQGLSLTRNETLLQRHLCNKQPQKKKIEWGNGDCANGILVGMICCTPPLPLSTPPPLSVRAMWAIKGRFVSHLSKLDRVSLSSKRPRPEGGKRGKFLDPLAFPIEAHNRLTHTYSVRTKNSPKGTQRCVLGKDSRKKISKSRCKMALLL